MDETVASGQAPDLRVIGRLFDLQPIVQRRLLVLLPFAVPMVMSMVNPGRLTQIQQRIGRVVSRPHRRPASEEWEMRPR